MSLEEAVLELERIFKLEVDPSDSFELRATKAWIAGSDWMEQKRIAALPAHNAKVDPFNKECPFPEGTRVRLIRPIPGENEEGIQVGDEGIVDRGFAGVLCVRFLKAPEFGLMSSEDIWITDLCEEIT